MTRLAKTFVLTVGAALLAAYHLARLEHRGDQSMRRAFATADRDSARRTFWSGVARNFQHN